MYDKTEELKKVLELDKEVIQTKLKEEKLRLDEETRKENERQKKLFYILSTITIIIFALAITAFTLTNDEKTATVQPEKQETITSTKKEETTTLVNKKEIPEKKIHKQEPKVVVVEKIVKTEPKEIIKIVEKEVIVTKEVPMPKEKLAKMLNGKKFNIAKCYDYTNTTLKPTNSCKKTLSEFFEKNKDSIRFEIIGVIGEDDIKKATALTQNKKIKDYIIRGVARDRVVEAAWLIKEVHKSKTLITPVNYYITSKKNNKGIVVRAYH